MKSVTTASAPAAAQLRSALETLAGFEPITLALNLSLPPETWLALASLAKRNGQTLEAAAAEAIATNELNDRLNDARHESAPHQEAAA